MCKRLTVGIAVAACAAVALQVQVAAQQGRGGRPAAGGTIGSGPGYPTPEQYTNSKEAQAHVAKENSHEESRSGHRSVHAGGSA